MICCTISFIGVFMQYSFGIRRNIENIYQQVSAEGSNVGDVEPGSQGKGLGNNNVRMFVTVGYYPFALLCSRL